MTIARADIQPLLDCLPLSADGTGHVADCGYDEDGEVCGCYTLPERLVDAVERIIAARPAPLGADVAALAEVLSTRLPRNQHGQLCPCWTRAKTTTLADCDCWQRRLLTANAEAVLASDWLAAHDARVRAAVAADAADTTR